jgi:tetratricopeptide (TPR) repeat protein
VILALALCALGADPFGRLAIETSPGATLEVLPTVYADQIVVAVRGNHVPLHDQLDGRAASGLLDVSLVSVGGGTWFLTLYPERPELVLEVRPAPAGYTLALRPGRPEPPLRLPPGPPALADLYADRVPRRPERPPTRPLLPLLGDASPVLAAGEHALDLPQWAGPSVTGPDSARLAPPDPHGWSAIEGYREVLCSSADADARHLAMWRLALAHLELGLAREADHYLARLVGQPRVPQLPVLLQRARTAAVLGRWDAMRGHCQAAAAIAPDDVAVLQCHAVLAVQTGRPAPAAAGRVLLEVAQDDDDRALAARALLRDGAHAEALPILRALVEGGEAPPDDALLAMLGDAEYAEGELDRARAAWESVRWDGDLGELARVRLHMLDMLEAGPEGWPQRVPALEAAADRGGPAGAEALHLVAQVAHRHGDPELEAEALASMLAWHRELAERGDVLARLVDACTGRLDHLHRGARYVEEAAFFRRCWDRRLVEVVRDTGPIERAAVAYEALGLPEAALDLQLEATRMHARDGQPRPDALARLAALYLAAGRPDEALRTVDYVQRGAGARDLAPALARTAARAQLALGRPDAALAVLARVPADDLEGRALRAGILADLRGCPPAEADLVAAAAADPASRARLARCRLEAGQVDEATALLASLGDDPVALGLRARLVLAGGAVESAPESPLIDALRRVPSTSDPLGAP